MKAPAFRYAKPRTLTDALALMAEHGDAAQPLAGGQSLIPLLNLRMAAPEVLIDLNGLTELQGIRLDSAHVVIGALIRHADIANDAMIARHVPLLAEAAPHIAHVAIRSRGTFGGSLALADPAAEWPACCLALDAEIVLASVAGRRTVPARTFFQGLYTTDRRPNELITSVRIPVAASNGIQAFREISRRRGDFAIAGLALTANRVARQMANIKLAFCGVSDRPILATAAMTELEGRELSNTVIEQAVARLQAELDPPDDPAYPSAYRRRVACALFQRTLTELQADLPHAA